MRLLLDENIPHELRREVTWHDAFTTAYMGWNGIVNGELLRLAAADGFDALVTLDNGIAYQTKLTTLPVAVVILSARSNRFQDIARLVPALLIALTTLAPHQVTRVV